MILENLINLRNIKNLRDLEYWLFNWEIPAYIHWYGASQYNSELVIALLKYWHEKYGSF
ncbi:hypothetical protein VB715_00655 [Crocosphaera sp. UHCC 0190]|uniref:hypothetical protein n=1 Tax=Crocosphaera sp. UHCC 0190 TaxID=3110246 RepID=UPI002B201ED6|nr:hypothetical protein [Crocosphaera sp. UHCC 0190]MEA5508264.1 hypothetical protein [Crocosphaera sp. UHCC 0190]